MVRAETAKPSAAETTAAAPARSNPHLRLCAQLGLKAGRTYEFMIFNNEEVHYWTILSLGAKGWIRVKDSRHPESWLNLSQVIAVTPVTFSAAPERPRKPNRTRNGAE